MVVFFNVVMVALGVYYGQSINQLLGFVLKKELVTLQAVAGLIGLILVPVLCLYGAITGNYLLICFVALAGYLVEEQRLVLDDAVEKLVLQKEELEAANAFCGLLSLKIAHLKTEIAKESELAREQIDLLVGFDRELKLAVAEIGSLRALAVELQSQLTEARSAQAKAEDDLFSLLHLLSEEELAHQHRLRKEYLVGKSVETRYFGDKPSDGKGRGHRKGYKPRKAWK